MIAGSKIVVRWTAVVITALFMVPQLLQSVHYIISDHQHGSEATSGVAITISKSQEKCAVCDFKLYLFTAEALHFPEFRYTALYNLVSVAAAKHCVVEKGSEKQGRAPPIPFNFQLKNIYNPN